MPSTRLQRGTAIALQALALLLLALHLYAYFLPATPPNSVPDAAAAESQWWGLWPVHYWPLWPLLLGALGLTAAVVAVWAVRSKPRPLLAAWQPFLLPLVTALLVAAFYLLPIVHTRWGDAFMLAKGIAYPDPALRITHSWQAPLDVFLHSQLWLALHAQFAWEDAMPVYRLLSPLAGLLYLLVVLALSRERRLAPPWLTYGLLATLGLMQLFFGYVENYSFAAAAVLAYLWLGLGVTAGRRPLWWAAVVLAIANATHPSTVVLAPSLLYLGWQRWQGRLQGNKRLAAVVGEIALPMLLIGGTTFLWMEGSGHGVYALLNTDRPGGGDARWLVPLWQTTTRWEHYTMFSWPHLRDWLNQQLLVAPVVLPSLLIVFASLWAAQRRPHQDGALSAADGSSAEQAARQTAETAGTRVIVRFLAIAALFYWLFTFVWNPDYGGQRDWDLFSLAALPATLLLIALLPRALPDSRLLRAGVVPLLFVQGWHTLAWLHQNTLPWHWPD